MRHPLEHGPAHGPYPTVSGRMRHPPRRTRSSGIPSDYLPQYLQKDEETLKRHFIPTNKRLWTVDRFEDFLAARSKLIWSETAALLAELGE
jgi:hypothetical protein